MDAASATPVARAGAPSGSNARRTFRSSADLLQALVVPALLLLIWELSGQAGLLPAGIFPWPSLAAKGWYVWAFGEPGMGLNSYSGTWFSNVYYSAMRVSQGYALAIGLAVPIGTMIGWSPLFARFVDPTLQGLRPVPITAWLPFSIALFGITDLGAISLIALGAFYPIVVNSAQGAATSTGTSYERP